MKRERSTQAALLIRVMVAGFLLHNLVTPVLSIRFEDQKNYYSPDPHGGSPPGGSPGTPHHGSTPPHGNPTPSHGGYNPTPSPPTNCGNPPHEPTTPSNPPGGGYYHSPPTSGGGSPPVITPSPPSIITPSPPSFTPGTPTIPAPPFDPNTPVPGTCIYWSTHPGLIWGLLGWWGTLGSSLGLPSVRGFGSNMSLLQALSNTRTDGLGVLYREGTASWLNSLANNRFPFSTKQVRDSFMIALHSDEAAAAQAQLFKLANEGRLKPRA